jgi:dihydroorotase
VKRIIKEARIVTPEGIIEGDLSVEGGRITRLGGVLETGPAVEIPAEGRVVLPGVIDPHVHFREPGLTHKETLATGSGAAVVGGVTSFLDMPNTLPPVVDQRGLDAKLALAARTSYAHFGFFIAAANDNLEALVTAERAAGIKIFVGSSTGNLLVEAQEVLEAIFAQTTLPIATHCEDETTVRANAERLRGESDAAVHSLIRTPEAAARSVARIVELAQRHQHRTHILHLSSRAELAELPAAAEVAGPVTAEVCIPHLFLDTCDYERLGTLAKVNPALREPAERQAAWDALRAGQFACVATDHAPHTLDEKSRGYWEAPSGLPSVENALALMLDAVGQGLLTLEDVVRLMCEGPARVWGIPRKGAIREGWDADLVLVEIGLERTVRHEAQMTKAAWSPWHGRVLRGWPVMTLVMGEVVAQDGRLVGAPGGRAWSFAL